MVIEDGNTCNYVDNMLQTVLKLKMSGRLNSDKRAKNGGN